MQPSPLDLFSSDTREWFDATFDGPTGIQELAWPRIAGGEHTLITAPTGSGKTLTAFLWAIDRLLDGHWQVGATRVLYITPVKALGNDIQRNLVGPLQELEERRRTDGRPTPEVRVGIRSGDTPQSERRRMLKDPPEILITTPESLNLLLTSGKGRRLLEHLETVILDEIHALVESKRGVHLITAVERLVALSGEVQRIGLSATVHPLDRVARWLGGRIITPGGHQDRAVAVLQSQDSKKYRLNVCSTLNDGDDLPRDREAFWQGLAASLRRDIRKRTSTLIFANSRRMVERVARLVNENAGDRLAWSHHGALSREIRHVVEQRLKKGELKAIVATNSLELGIDVGAIDEVVMVQSPPSVASTIQRLGRSGHQVGETSCGRLLPVHARDLLQCAVAGAAALVGDLEPIRPLSGALDVLAQVTLSMTVGKARKVDEVFAVIRCADPYRHLSRSHFDLVIEMLAGRYASTRMRALRPLVSFDRVDGTILARPGSDRLLYLAGGTIPDRGYYHLRLEGSGAPLGELDEEFVWERSVGDTFTLGVQAWKVEKITHSDVFVTPAPQGASMAPFWRAEERDGSLHLAGRVAELLETLEPLLNREGPLRHALAELPLADNARIQLLEFLAEQISATSCLPHRHRVLVEHVESTRGRSGERQVILHTLWGGRANRALALALQSAWRRTHATRPGVIHDDDCVIVSAPVDAFEESPFDLVNPDDLEELLRANLASTGYFGARFREAAGVALLLPRAGWNRRTPLWLHRQRAKEMLDVVRTTEDFPLVLEAWRSCLDDGLDIEGLRSRLQEVREGRIEVRHIRTEHPSPLAAHVLWKQTNELMYDDDRPEGSSAPVRDDLFAELTTSPHLRPDIDPALATELHQKLQRTAEGYAPAPGRDLVDWIVERVLITDGEWQSLSAAVARDHGEGSEAIAASVASRVVCFTHGGTKLFTAIEHLPRLVPGLKIDRNQLEEVSGCQLPNEHIDAILSEASAADTMPLTVPELFAERLRFSGPIPVEQLSADLGCETSTTDAAVRFLADEGVIVVDQITAGAPGPEVCDRENLERLLRLARARSRPSFSPRPAEELPLFLATHQGLGAEGDRLEDFRNQLEALLAWPAPASAWETELLPARTSGYHTAWLDTLLIETDLRWMGCGDKKLTLILEQDRSMLSEDDPESPADAPEIKELFPHRLGRFTFEELHRHSAKNTAELTDDLWRGVWAGRVSADTFAAIRSAVQQGFKTPAPIGHQGGRRRRARRGDLERWKAARPFEGHWFALPGGERAPADALDRDEENRDRIRLLLDRYGVLFRQILVRELPAFRWGGLFRSLRLMELSGEVVAGRFFEGLPGLQFMDHAAFRKLRSGLPEDHIWWLNANDPASPCALGLDAFDGRLPRRNATSHLVFHGRRLVVVSEAGSKRLTIEPASDHPGLPRYFDFLRTALGRQFQAKKSVNIESINDEPAASSPYRAVFDQLFHTTKSGTGLRLSRRF